MPLALAILAIALQSNPAANLVKNPAFTDPDATTKKPTFYELKGSAVWQYGGYADEFSTPGISLRARAESGSVSQLVTGIDQSKGKWLRFTFRGMPEPGFKVDKDALYMQMEFFAKVGKESMDSARRLIYREIQQDRSKLEVNGNNGKEGSAAWRTYEFEELLPFPEVDSVRISVAFEHGLAKQGERDTFFVDDFSLTQSMQSSRGLVEPMNTQTKPTQIRTSMISVGGRWLYLPAENEKLPLTGGKLTGRLVVNYQNADRLFYDDGTLSNPFADNMTAWMRKGYMDRTGKILTEDRFVSDNLVIEFNGSPYMTLRAKNIPNHQTAKFPDTYGTQGYNPSYIQEHDYVYRLPLDPKPNPNAQSMTANDSNGALPMGAVGVAVNGVVFYNPFDAGMQDASSIMDRCCGHPSPDNRYHYHKYPICVNTPFVDKGEAHSPVIGFAFDGFPVYGPYEEKGVMAKDLTTNSLNAFNAHYDAKKGWHYHVTPGKFPYIIGGYWGSYDMRRPR